LNSDDELSDNTSSGDDDYESDVMMMMTMIQMVMITITHWMGDWHSSSTSKIAFNMLMRAKMRVTTVTQIPRQKTVQYSLKIQE
jgi:hypothetical protein